MEALAACAALKERVRAGLGRLGERKSGLGRVRGSELGPRGRGLGQLGCFAGLGWIGFGFLVFLFYFYFPISNITQT